MSTSGPAGPAPTSLPTWRSSFRRPTAKRKRRPRLAPSLGSAGHSIGGEGGATTAPTVAEGRVRCRATYSPRRRSPRRGRCWASASAGCRGDGVVGVPRASTGERRAGHYVRSGIRSQHIGGGGPARLRSGQRRCRCRRQGQAARRLPAPLRSTRGGRSAGSGRNHGGSRSLIDEPCSKAGRR